MKNRVAFVLFFLIFSISAYCAPTEPVEQSKITGEIESLNWVQERSEPGQWGMSGSLGGDRTFPAGYWVVLKNVTQEFSKEFNDLNSLKKEKPASNVDEMVSLNHLKIFINHKKNDGFLKIGMKIQVLEYTYSGDEGGIWYSNSGVKVIESTSSQSMQKNASESSFIKEPCLDKKR